MTIINVNSSSDFGSNDNCLYIISHDISLSAYATNPLGLGKDCVLKFEGGSLVGGKLKGDATYIDAPLVKVFSGVTLSGSFKNAEWPVEWWGASPALEPELDTNTSSYFCDEVFINEAITQVANTDFGGKVILN